MNLTKEIKMHSFQVSYNINKGISELSYGVYPTYEHTVEVNTPDRVTKIFSAETEKEAYKMAETFSKSHNKVVRDARKEVKAKIEAAKLTKKAEKVAKVVAIKERTASFISPEIKKIITSIFEIQKAEVLVTLQGQYKRAIGFLKSVEGLDYKSKEWVDVVSYKFKGRTYQTFCGEIYWKLMDQQSKSYNEYSYTFKPGYKKIVEKMIQNDLDGIMAAFLYKMEFKLGEVIKGKEIEKFISEGLHDGFVMFKFKDGTSFQMKNTIEWGTSKLGVSFQRFPCRFHDVKFSDGQLIKWASEEEMKKKF